MSCDEILELIRQQLDEILGYSVRLVKRASYGQPQHYDIYPVDPLIHNAWQITIIFEKNGIRILEVSNIYWCDGYRSACKEDIKGSFEELDFKGVWGRFYETKIGERIIEGHYVTTMKHFAVNLRIGKVESDNSRALKEFFELVKSIYNYVDRTIEKRE